MDGHRVAGVLGPGADGEDVVVVAEYRLAVDLIEGELFLVALRAEDREPEFAAGPVVVVPVDVEVALVLTVPAELEHIPPPRVLAWIVDTEMVRDDVDDDPEAVFAGGRREAPQT